MCVCGFETLHLEMGFWYSLYNGLQNSPMSNILPIPLPLYVWQWVIIPHNQNYRLFGISTTCLAISGICQN